MKIFDMHTHCFPDKLAPKALPTLALLRECGLTENELKMICCKNAERVFSLTLA